MAMYYRPYRKMEEADDCGGRDSLGNMLSAPPSNFLWRRPSDASQSRDDETATGTPPLSPKPAPTDGRPPLPPPRDDLDELVLAHTIDAHGLQTTQIASTADLMQLLRSAAAEKKLVWCEFRKASSVASVIRKAPPKRGGLAALQHPVVFRLLLAQMDLPVIETVNTWTLWSVLVPHPLPGRRLRFLAVSRGRVLLTAVHLTAEDRAPPGGWWHREKRSDETRQVHSGSFDAPLLDRFDEVDDELDDDCEEPIESGPRQSLASAVDCAQHFLETARDDGDERGRCVTLGGAYVCARLMEAALLSARATIDDIDESISKLVQVCDDERSGWRHHRVRFNRTVRMLMEAGRTRAVISRLREYYEQSAIVAKAAAARVAGDEDMALWVRQLDVLASGDLRRLHHQDNVLHSYVLVARTRHEDDYNRINILLSLVATIFLPLSFLSGVFGMNFDFIPLRTNRWAFVGFFVVAAAIVIGGLLSFWYRGWLNVITSAWETAPSRSRRRRRA